MNIPLRITQVPLQEWIFLCILLKFRCRNEYSSAYYSSSSAGMNILLHNTQFPTHDWIFLCTLHKVRCTSEYLSAHYSYSSSAARMNILCTLLKVPCKNVYPLTHYSRSPVRLNIPLQITQVPLQEGIFFSTLPVLKFRFKNKKPANAIKKSSSCW
jgi:hypothetical protein